MASASSAACQATSMTNKLRQQWAAKQRAASLDAAHLPAHLPPAHLPSAHLPPAEGGRDALAPLGRLPAKPAVGEAALAGKPSWPVTAAIMDRFSGLGGRRRNPSGDSTASDGSEAAAAAAAELPGRRRRHFSESSVLSGDVSMDAILVSNP